MGKEFTPWLLQAEKASNEGLVKPSSLDEVKALHNKVGTSDKTAVQYLKVLTAANDAAQKMTTHTEADAEVAALRARYDKVKVTSDEWVKKVDVLLKEWTLRDNTVTELNSWVAKGKTTEGENQFSLEKMESTLGELKNIFKEKEKLLLACKTHNIQHFKDVAKFSRNHTEDMKIPIWVIGNFIGFNIN